MMISRHNNYVHVVLREVERLLAKKKDKPFYPPITPHPHHVRKHLGMPKFVPSIEHGAIYASADDILVATTSAIINWKPC